MGQEINLLYCYYKTINTYNMYIDYIVRVRQTYKVIIIFLSLPDSGKN